MLRKWLLASAGFFSLSVLVGLVLVMLLNGGVVNYMLTPVFQYTALFGVLWDDNPLGALRFILTKTVIAFAHKDPRSGLNIWTYEFDSVSLLLYAAVAMLAGFIVLRTWRVSRRSLTPAGWTGLGGCLFLLLSVSYMTSIEHCSGATWVGFVTLYGLGFDEFELYPAWQWLTAGIGAVLLAVGFVLSRSAASSKEVEQDHA